MRIKILLFFFVILFCVKPVKTIAQVSVQDSLALVDYYDSTYGIQPWQWGQVWEFQSPVNSWVGVGVSNYRVTSIRLWGGGGAGHIPASFGNLTEHLICGEVNLFMALIAVALCNRYSSCLA